LKINPEICKVADKGLKAFIHEELWEILFTGRMNEKKNPAQAPKICLNGRTARNLSALEKYIDKNILF